MRRKKDSQYQLLVEGIDDSAVIRHLLRRHEYDWDHEPATKPYVNALDGIDNVLAALPQELRNRETRRLGVVVDVDLKLEDRWQALCDRVAQVGITLPHQPVPGGTVVDGMFPGSQLGIWLMPDNRSTGTLEHFVEKLVPVGDPCWGYADEVSNEAHRRYGDAGCPEKDLSKSRLYTWLAWQREPGRPFGIALTAQILGHDSPEARAFLAWFYRLFPTKASGN